ncbi:hypothetical protein ABZP36_000451 [Zizania latifolia]
MEVDNSTPHLIDDDQRDLAELVMHEADMESRFSLRLNHQHRATKSNYELVTPKSGDSVAEATSFPATGKTASDLGNVAFVVEKQRENADKQVEDLAEKAISVQGSYGTKILFNFVTSDQDIESLFPVAAPDQPSEQENRNHDEHLRSLPPSVAAGLSAENRLFMERHDNQ